MRMRKLTAVILAVVMVMAVLPCVSLAAGSETAELTASKSVTMNINTGVVTDTYSSSYDTSNLYVYHSNWNQRTAFVGFDLSSLTDEQKNGEKSVVEATLTVNCVEAATLKQPEISLLAVDNTLWNESEYTDPSVLNIPSYNVTSVLSTIPDDMVRVDKQSVTGTGTLTFDVTDYVAENLTALVDDGISFALASITETIYSTDNTETLKVLFEGKNGTNPPTLAITFGEGASVKLQLSAGGKVVETKEITGLVAGDSYTPSDSDAPNSMEIDGDLYTKDDFAAVELEAGENVVTVTYTKTSVASVAAPSGEYSAIAGNVPNLPKTLVATTATGVEVELDAAWTTSADVDSITKETTVTYEAKVDGVSETIKKDVTIYPCDHAIGTDENPTFWHSGDDSNSADFSYNNPLGYEYGGGTVIAELDFTIDDGTNKLIMYGAVADIGDRFNGVAAALRFMNGSEIFEYHSGGWATSSVSATYGASYRLRTVIDVTNKTYSMYVSEEGGEYQTVCENAAFRNSSCAQIDRMYTSGAITTSVHRIYWQDGYSVLTVSDKLEDGTLIDTFTTKATTGKTYTYTGASDIIAKNGKYYMRDNIDEYPSVEVSGDTASLEVIYKEVEIESVAEASASLVQGDSTINLPTELAVTFSDGQSLNYAVTWDTSKVDTDTAGEYEVTGTIADLGNYEASATVTVKTITVLDKTSENTVVTNNGGWNWYVEPSGTHIQPGDDLANLYEGKTYDEDGNLITYTSNNGYVFQHDRTYMGWVEDGGDIVVAMYDHDTDEYTRVILHEKLESDDHNNPAVVVLPDGRIMAVYSMHTNEPYMYFRVSKNPEDITEWNAEQYYYCQNTLSGESDTYNATYPTVFMVHDDDDGNGDAIYVGWRGVHWKPTLAKIPMPDENGHFGSTTDQVVPLMGQTQFANTTYGYSTYTGADAPNAKTDGGYTDNGRRPYTKYDYDYIRNKIYITFTANHPDNDKQNNIYYICLDIEDQNLYTAKGTYVQPLPKNNLSSYASMGAAGTSGQWGLVTADLVDTYPELLVFDATAQTNGDTNAERRGWTWDIKVNEKGEPCIVYVDVTATAPGENGELPTTYVAATDDNSRRFHYYWYARWDSETEEWVNTFLTYGGKWWHENATQERCYSGGLTFDHNYDANVIYLSIPTMGKYGNIFEIYRWESDDDGATWTTREPLTVDSATNNARPNAIYNYKMNDDGTNAGPRLLWISGEYRYWMNYEYKTGVWTDFAAPGFTTQDDPEMSADAALYADGEKLEALPVGETTVTGVFNITNISIGDGTVMTALAHYNSEGALVKVETQEVEVPARSVPQTGIVGAPVTEDGSLSKMGDPEVIVEMEYTAEFEEGDRIALLAWNIGIEHPMASIMTIPFSMTTDGDKYIYKETFTYDGEDKLVLNDDESTYNGWVGSIYSDGSTTEFTDSCYAAITKAPFGNTGLHMYHVGSGAIMASHELPELSGDSDYQIEFTIRYINEQSWNNTANAGFTLSYKIPEYGNDNPNDSGYAAAFQFRFGTNWNNENGRGTVGYVRDTCWFDGSGLTEIFSNGISRDLNVSGMEKTSYSKGTAYYDPETETYVHDYNDSLMAGSLFRFKITVSPSNNTIDLEVNDGYRTATYSTDYCDYSAQDWEANPINAITFSIGDDKWGEMYIDNISIKVVE